MRDTLILDRSAVRAAVDVDLLTEELGQGLLAYAGLGNPQRVRARLDDNLTAMVLIPGLVEGISAYTVKVHAKNPTVDEPIRGLLMLHDLPTGELLAVMDSGWLTAQRTALAAAYVHDRLAEHPLDGPVAIIGAGIQGATTARALSRRQPGRRFTIYDSNNNRANALRSAIGPQSAEVASTPEIALTGATSAVTATWGRSPVATLDAFLHLEHVTVLGMDEAGKEEIPTGFLDLATVYVDDPVLAAPILHRECRAVGPALDRYLARGRSTVYIAVGLPMQDCVAAWHVYKRAVAGGLGRPLNFRM